MRRGMTYRVSAEASPLVAFTGALPPAFGLPRSIFAKKKNWGGAPC
jgi:hypothetical protein